ncbi:hypothetical protein TRAPUB_14044 [Trametes pubescens]|uniref:Uncharacterized protein n=1 Tax=Trametes pubescens TaxID=154538 RepID=A0A1M2VPE8_TRAPU|nr:hypothetical protein TRAPUB_14044 [Trametes pubescens]
MPVQSFVGAQKAISKEPLLISCPERPYPWTSSLPPDSLPACHRHNSSPVGSHPPNKRGIGAPGVVIAPHPCEHTLNQTLGRIYDEDRNHLGNISNPIDTTFGSGCGEAIALDASASTSYPYAPVDGAGHTLVHHATSGWTRGDPMPAAPLHTFDPTTTHAYSNAVVHSDGFAFPLPLDHTLASPPEHPIGGYAHLHNGRSVHPHYPQTSPAMDVLLPDPPRHKPTPLASGESGAFMPQSHLLNTNAHAVPHSRTVAAQAYSVGSQDRILPPFHPPSSELCGRLHMPSFQDAAALDRIDEIASRGARIQGPAQRIVDPGRTPSQKLAAQSAAIVSPGLALYREDVDQAMAPLGLRMHGMERLDLALPTGSSPVSLPRAGNRDMLHRKVPARKSTYSSLAGAVTSPDFVPTTTHIPQTFLFPSV